MINLLVNTPEAYSMTRNNNLMWVHEFEYEFDYEPKNGPETSEMVTPGSQKRIQLSFHILERFILWIASLI